MAGLRNKDTDLWERIKEWEVIIMMETWMDEKGWKVWKGILPRGYSCVIQYAERKSKKGRAMGRMVMGIRNEL